MSSINALLINHQEKSIEQKEYSTQGSQVVSHPSTYLTSQIERDEVFSTQDDRTRIRNDN